jgi:hypothetical protein
LTANAIAQTNTAPFTLQWSSNESDLASSVAWGDYDTDGALDLAIGNDREITAPEAQPNRLYRNDNGVLTQSAVWSSTERDDTQNIAWDDYDETQPVLGTQV